MSTDPDLREVAALLQQIRDNQRLALEQQKAHVELTREQVERARTQVAESIAIQKEALTRQKTVFSIAMVGIAICLGLIVYLLVRYF